MRFLYLAFVKVWVKPFQSSFTLGNLTALFLLPVAGTKEKAKQKENAVEEISPPAAATGDAGLCPTPRKPLKRLGLNFQKKFKVKTSPLTTPFLRHCLRVRSSLLSEQTAIQRRPQLHCFSFSKILCSVLSVESGVTVIKPSLT